MKEWIVELCPEISEWQADMIAEAVYNSVLEEREACAQLVLQGTGEAVQTRTLEILQSERQRIADAIRERGQA